MIRTYRTYWSLYGGASALWKSPYLYAAAALTAVLAPLWMETAQGRFTWVQIAIDVIPSLLGFSMGGMAIMLAFSNKTIFSAISQAGNKRSYFMKVVANFFHFILVQTIALFLTLAVRAYEVWVFSGAAFFAFAYAVLIALAIAAQLLQTARIFNAAGSLLKHDDQSD